MRRKPAVSAASDRPERRASALPLSASVGFTFSGVLDTLVSCFAGFMFSVFLVQIDFGLASFIHFPEMNLLL